MTIKAVNAFVCCVVLITSHSCKLKGPAASTKSVADQGYKSEMGSIIGLFDGVTKAEPDLGPGAADVIDPRLRDKTWFNFFTRYRNATQSDRCKNAIQDDPQTLLPYVSVYVRKVLPPPPKGTRGKLHLIGADEAYAQDAAAQKDKAYIELLTFLNMVIDVCESKDDSAEKDNLEKYGRAIRDQLTAMKDKLTISTRSLFTLHVVQKFPSLLLWEFVANAKLSLTNKDANYNYPNNIPVDTVTSLFLQKTTPSLRQHQQLQGIQDSTYSWDELGMYTNSGIPLYYTKFAEFSAKYPLITGAIPLLGTSLAAADSLLTLKEGKDAQGRPVSANQAQMELVLNIALATIDGAVAYESVGSPIVQKIRSSTQKTVEKIKTLRAKVQRGETLTVEEVTEFKNTAKAEAEQISGVSNGGGEAKSGTKLESIAKNMKFKACSLSTVKALGLSTVGLELSGDDCIMSPVFPELEDLYKELLGADTYGKIAANTQPVLDTNYIVGNADLLQTERMKQFIKNGEYKSPDQYLFIEKTLPSGHGTGAWSSLDGRMLIEEFSADEVDVIIAPGRTHADDAKDFLLGGKYLKQKETFTNCSSQCHTVVLTKSQTLQAETKGLTEGILKELYDASQHP